MTTTNGTTAEPSQVTTMMVRHESRAIEPANFSELMAMAKHAAESRFFGAKNPSQALMLMQAGKDLGLSYTQALRMFHVIEDKPTLSAAGMVAVCIGHPEVCEYVTTVENTDERATVEVKRVGKEPKRATFTMADAQRAKLVKPGSGWEKYPSRMLLARARSFACHEEFEDLLAGLYDPDEIRGSRGESEARHVDVVAAPAPSSPSVADGLPDDPSIDYAAHIELKIRNSADNDELDAAAAWVARAEREQKITPEQAKLLGRLGKGRRAELAKA